MIINDLRPRGYCHGVARALNIVKKAILDETVKKPLYILGLIVHNKKIKEALDHYNVISFSDPGITRMEMINHIEDGTVILTAHGVANKVKDTLENRNIPYIDATCKDVYKVHDHITNHLPTHEIVYIGKQHHPEVEGVLGLDDSIVLLTTVEEAKTFVKKTDKPLYVTNQTTLSLYEVMKIVDELKTRYDLEFDNDICMATTMRQKAVLKQPQADVLIVVGDSLSSNTNKLQEVSNRQTSVKAYRIETINDIDPAWFKGVQSVNVTSGASTPKAITNEVIDYLRQFDYHKKETWEHVSKVTYLDILS